MIYYLLLKGYLAQSIVQCSANASSANKYNNYKRVRMSLIIVMQDSKASSYRLIFSGYKTGKRGNNIFIHQAKTQGIQL